MTNRITIIPALGDNFIYLCRYAQNKAFVIDPGEALAVEVEIEKQNIEPTHIFLTHHHYDHTAGANELKKKYGCEIISAGERPPKLSDMKIEIIETLGHTKDSVCYYITSGDEKAVFTGDTLFIGGCGRPMECSRQEMYKSLKKLIALPDETLVYSGHDYTMDNYNFGLSIEPNNPEIKEAIEQLKAGNCPVPSSIGREKKTNVFLRADCVPVKHALNMAGAPAADVFAELRRRKNAWG